MIFKENTITINRRGMCFFSDRGFYPAMQAEFLEAMVIILSVQLD